MSLFVFALGSLPDVEGLRRLHGLPAELMDAEVAEFAFQRRRAETGSGLLAPQFRRVAAFACAGFDAAGRFHLHAADDTHEPRLLEAIFMMFSVMQGAPLYWSEREASLANLRLRSLQAGLAVGAGWAQLARAECIGSQLAAPGDAPDLASVAKLAGLPLARGFDHEAVWRASLAGDARAVRVDAESRALAACLLALRWRTLAANSNGVRAEGEQTVRTWLADQDAAHFRHFAEHWR